MQTFYVVFVNIQRFVPVNFNISLHFLLYKFLEYSIYFYPTFKYSFWKIV